MLQRTDQDRQRPRFRPSFYAKYLVNRRQIYGIGRQRVQRVGGYGDHRAAIQPPRGIADHPWVRVFRANSQNFSSKDYS